jgi:hypothetical protein
MAAPALEEVAVDAPAMGLSALATEVACELAPTEAESGLAAL